MDEFGLGKCYRFVGPRPRAPATTSAILLQHEFSGAKKQDGVCVRFGLTAAVERELSCPSEGCSRSLGRPDAPAQYV